MSVYSSNHSKQFQESLDRYENSTCVTVVVGFFFHTLSMIECKYVVIVWLLIHCYDTIYLRQHSQYWLISLAYHKKIKQLWSKLMTTDDTDPFRPSNEKGVKYFIHTD